MRELTKIVRADAKSFSELTVVEQGLLLVALRARVRAQAPYSNYLVGAAVLSSCGSIYAGCNVERCTYSQTTHAEQNAVDSMVAGGDTKIAVVAVVGAPRRAHIDLPGVHRQTEFLTDIAAFPFPCGHCLQIIWENCSGDPNVELIGLTENGEVAVTIIGDALPMRFGPKNIAP